MLWNRIYLSIYLYIDISCCLVTQSCLTFCDPMDCSSPGSCVHGISQARILEWVAISFSKGSSQPKDQTCVSCIGQQILYRGATWEAFYFLNIFLPKTFLSPLNQNISFKKSRICMFCSYKWYLEWFLAYA